MEEKPLPFKSDHTYYGDEWLEFHDFLQGITERESVFVELSFQLGLINPRELAYKTGGKAELLQRIKCIVEVNREPDQTKHAEILEKYGIQQLPPPEPPVSGHSDNIYS